MTISMALNKPIFAALGGLIGASCFVQSTAIYQYARCKFSNGDYYLASHKHKKIYIKSIHPELKDNLTYIFIGIVIGYSVNFLGHSILTAAGATSYKKTAFLIGSKLIPPIMGIFQAATSFKSYAIKVSDIEGMKQKIKNPPGYYQNLFTLVNPFSLFINTHRTIRSAITEFPPGDRALLYSKKAR